MLSCENNQLWLTTLHNCTLIMGHDPWGPPSLLSTVAQPGAVQQLLPLPSHKPPSAVPFPSVILRVDTSNTLKTLFQKQVCRESTDVLPSALFNSRLVNDLKHVAFEELARCSLI